jgi:hypothetical protein
MISRKNSAAALEGARLRLITPLIHMSTVVWFAGGLALVAAAFELRGSARLIACLMVGFSFLYGAVLNLWATRGRHPGGYLMLLARWVDKKTLGQDAVDRCHQCSQCPTSANQNFACVQCGLPASGPPAFTDRCRITAGDEFAISKLHWIEHRLMTLARNGPSALKARPRCDQPGALRSSFCGTFSTSTILGAKFLTLGASATLRSVRDLEAGSRPRLVRASTMTIGRLMSGLLGPQCSRKNRSPFRAARQAVHGSLPRHGNGSEVSGVFRRSSGPFRVTKPRSSESLATLKRSDSALPRASALP